jgi:dihydroneopterin triphosphate diphosphatase
MAAGAAVRTDLVDAYVFRRQGGVQFLQLLRAREPLSGTWHPVMGHVEAAESSPQAAARELREEIGLDVAGSGCRGFWALPQVYPYYVASLGAVMLTPRFAAEVEPGFEPRVSAEHSAWRWVGADQIDGAFVWPGQRAACRDVLADIVPEASPTRAHLLVPGWGGA